jgi:hypothetical protein
MDKPSGFPAIMTLSCGHHTGDTWMVKQYQRLAGKISQVKGLEQIAFRLVERKDPQEEQNILLKIQSGYRLTCHGCGS